MGESDKLLAMIDSRFQAFGVRIAEFANLSTRFEALEHAVEALNAKHQELSADHSKSKERVDQRHLSHMKFVEYQEVQLDSRFKRAEESLADHGKDIKRLSEYGTVISLLMDRVADLERKFDALMGLFKEHQVKHSDLNVCFEKSKQDFLLFADSSRRVHSQIPVMQEFLGRCQLRLDEHSRSFDSLRSDLDWVRGQLHQSHDNLSSAIQQKSVAASEEIDKKLGALKIPDVSPFLERKEMDEVRHLVALSQLDAKNAVAKSNMQEMQLQILGKKIEGILIDLKRQELS